MSNKYGITPGLRIDAEKWKSFKEANKGKVNKMFNDWVSNDGHTFTGKERDDLKQALYASIKVLDIGNNADVELANRIEILMERL